MARPSISSQTEPKKDTYDYNAQTKVMQSPKLRDLRQGIGIPPHTPRAQAGLTLDALWTPVEQQHASRQRTPKRRPGEDRRPTEREGSSEASGPPVCSQRDENLTGPNTAIAYRSGPLPFFSWGLNPRTHLPKGPGKR